MNRRVSFSFLFKTPSLSPWLFLIVILFRPWLKPGANGYSPSPWANVYFPLRGRMFIRPFHLTTHHRSHSPTYCHSASLPQIKNRGLIVIGIKGIFSSLDLSVDPFC
jgi:hypothetical protein